MQFDISSGCSNPCPSKYFFNSDGDLKGKNVKKVIDISSYQNVINWDTIKNDQDVDRAIIRVGWGMSYNDAAGTDSYFDRNIKENTMVMAVPQKLIKIPRLSEEDYEKYRFNA